MVGKKSSHFLTNKNLNVLILVSAAIDRYAEVPYETKIQIRSERIQKL